MEKQFTSISYPSNSFKSYSTVIGVNNHTVNKNTLDSLIPNECFSGSFIKGSCTNGFLARYFSTSTSFYNLISIISVNDGPVVMESIKRVMECPKIEIPAFKYLYDFSPDLINGHEIRMPIFLSQDSDIAFFGFDLDKVLAKGTSFTGTTPDDTSKPGWFFVFKEMMGEKHFGLDEFTETKPILISGDISNWDNLNWGHMGSLVSDIKFAKTSISVNLSLTTSGVDLNRNAADVSQILLRKPAFICLHAKELLS